MKHKHHSIPRSRGGTDDEWNLIEVDPYTHAYEHALDFVLFKKSPWFDCRHEAWPLLPRDLKEAVLTEMSVRMREGPALERAHKGGETTKRLGKGICDPQIRRLGGEKAKSSGQASALGQQQGKENVESGHLEQIRKIRPLNKELYMCLVTSKITYPGPLTCYQKARGIDPSLRKRVYD
jgi:hypothetical protein